MRRTASILRSPFGSVPDMACVRWRARFVGTALLLLGSAFGFDGAEEAEAQAIDQLSAVYIESTCTDSNNGETRTSQGSGVIVSATGHVLTAYHVIQCWLDQLTQERLKTRPKGRVGSLYEQARDLDVVRYDAAADVAVLKFLGAPGARNYRVAPLCSLRDPKPGTRFTATGFPLGQDYQPVDGQIGNVSAGGGRWAASVAFAYGMSGGPVFFDGQVVGLVKGGFKDDSNTVRYITPIYLGASLVRDAVGIDLPECSQAERTESSGAALSVCTMIASESASIYQTRSQASASRGQLRAGNIIKVLDDPEDSVWVEIIDGRGASGFVLRRQVEPLGCGA